MKWRVKNFKGIADCEVVLRSGTTTILSGVNSSGKTSVIQSLLLVRQTRPADRGVVLNGPLVRLGEAQDLVRDAEGADSITFMLEHEGDSYDIDLVPASSRTRSWRGAATEEDPLGTSLQVARLSIGSVSNAGLVRLVGRGIRASDASLIQNEISNLGEHSLLRLQPESEAIARGVLPRTYVVFNGIRPIWLARCYDKAKFRSSYRKRLTEAVEQFRDAVSGHGDIRRRNSSIARVLRNLLLNEMGPYLSASVDEHRVQWRPKSAPHLRGDDSVQQILDMADQDVIDLIDVIAENKSKNPVAMVELRRGPSLRDSGIMDNDLLEQSRGVAQLLIRYSNDIGHLRMALNYLGPLRDEPRVVWGQWNSETPGLPVGIRGELAAAYLAKNADKNTKFRLPLDTDTRESTLGEATDIWLKYLGIGTAMHAKSHGKIGVGLQVEIENVERDLTSVGVGVSQAFPIVLAGLAVPEGSVFIVEQPELHLHPDVQAKLADFFLFARPDVAFVVETHSEAMVTRVRRRVAEAASDPEDVQLIFVEPMSHDSKIGIGEERVTGAVGRRIEMTSTGDFEEWPSGFISGSLEDTQAILAANIQRIQRAKSHD